jgi:DNA-binding response OmpR family regulator
VSSVGPRVLIVEDEPIIVMLLEEYLRDAGCEVVASAVNLEKAIDLAATLDIHLAILDVSLGQNSSFPIANILTGRKIPFLFASGFGSQSLPAEYRHHRMLGKPFDFSELVEGIDATLAGRFPLNRSP